MRQTKRAKTHVLGGKTKHKSLRSQNHDPLPPEEPPSISPSPEPMIPNPEVPEIVPEIEPGPAPEAPPISPAPKETSRM